MENQSLSMQKELEDRMRAAREEVVYLYTCTWVKLTLTLTVRGPTLVVCRRQILTSEADPRTVREKIFLMALDP